MQPDEHLERVLRAITPVEAEVRALADALGMTLAAPAIAVHDLPHWDNSAMDGYAIRAADVVAEGWMPVAGEVLAGGSDDPPLLPGTAVRIMTGAVLPSQADTVVRVEDTSGRGAGGTDVDAAGVDVWDVGEIRIDVRPLQGANVRRRGEDVRAGDVVAGAGARLSAALCASLAAAGVEHVTVHRALRVAVVTTGNELRVPGEVLDRGQIVNSNALLLDGLLREFGTTPVAVWHVSDDPAGFATALAELGASSDVVVSTGGIGPGSHDVVRLAVRDEPGVQSVHLRMRPGQHQCTGRLRSGAYLFALPGNPVSAAISFELFVRPALLALSGRSRTSRFRVVATASAPWRGAAERTQVLPVRLFDTERGLACAPVVDSRQMSHAVGGHGGVEGYAIVGPERGDIAAGERVEVIVVAP